MFKLLFFKSGYFNSYELRLPLFVCVCRHCDMLSDGFLWDPFNFRLKGHHLYGMANSSTGELAFVEFCKPFVLCGAVFSDCINLQMGQKDQKVRYCTFIQML